MSGRLALAALGAAALAAGPLALAARADGDPASDYLLSQQVFLPFDVKLPAEKQRQLVGVVAAANRAGFKIRVALIASAYDLGSVTSLWGKPRPYARFLGEELQFVYKQRLLIVMPNGLGFHWTGHPDRAEYAVLDKIKVARGPEGLIDAATTAVQRLAAARGVKLQAAPPPSAPSHTRDRLLILAAAIAGLLIAVAARRVLRRRRG
jgi:hypothetical protein